MIKKTITITQQLNEQLNLLSKKTGLTISDLIRRAIEILDQEYNKKK